MAHWAEINENSIVTRVLVGDNNDSDEGYQWLIDNLGGNWVKTSYNTKGGVHTFGGVPFRKNYAGIGFTYDEDRDDARKFMKIEHQGSVGSCKCNALS